MVRTEITTETFDGVYHNVFELCAKQILEQTQLTDTHKLPKFMKTYVPGSHDAYRYVSRSTLYMLTHLTTMKL